MPDNQNAPLPVSFALSLPPGTQQLGIRPTQDQPLLGLTVLAVEDSRFASEVLRLLCQRSGARLRRAESLRAAWDHLRTYRPDVVIVDLGLPDGRGEDLIRDLARGGGGGADLTLPQSATAAIPAGHAGAPLILAISGDPSSRGAALTAGAAAFFEKPVESLAAFQDTLLSHLPDRAFLRRGSGAEPPVAIAPDRLALQDDLSHAADLIAEAATRFENRRYVAGFVRGLARSTHDSHLEEAARQAGHPGKDRFDRLAKALSSRVTRTENAFTASQPPLHDPPLPGRATQEPPVPQHDPPQRNERAAR
ncbi:MAG: response regulator [Paracoccaceae bacterium]|nr:response regulator [Paracoccaceae bacterium]